MSSAQVIESAPAAPHVPASASSGTKNDAGKVEPIVKSGSSNEVSFDDFEALETLTTPEKKSRAKKEPKEDEKKIDEGDSKGEGEGEADPKESPDKKDETEKPKEDASKKKPNAPKAYTLKTPDGEVKVMGDAVVTVTIDGKKEAHSLEDIINKYPGQVSIERNFNVLNQEKAAVAKEKKEFYSERDGLQSGLNKIHALCTGGKPMEAIFMMAEAMGADPIKTFEDVIVQTEKALGREVTPEEHAARREKWELSYHRGSQETAKATRTRESEIAQTRSSVESVQKLLGIDEKTFVSAYDELCEEAKRQGKPESIITPELVGDYVASSRRTSGVNSILESSFAERPETETQKIKSLLLDVWKQNPKWTVDHVKEIAIESFGAPKKSAIARKVEKSQKEKTVSTNPNHEPLTWDDV